VKFDFELALQVAKELHDLADEIHAKHQDRADLAPECEKQWTGPEHDKFVSKRGVEDTDAGTMRTELIDLANKFAIAWKDARGEQDRINFARYVQHEEESEGYGDAVGDFFVEDTYGDPPKDPDPPEGPDYRPTREPQYAEFEHAARV
jgi:hypothetical protein